MIFCFETSFPIFHVFFPIFFCLQTTKWSFSLQMSNLENHNPQVIRLVSKEVKNLATEQLEGIRIHLNESNLTDIQAVIEGPGKFTSKFLESFVKFMWTGEE